MEQDTVWRTTATATARKTRFGQKCVFYEWSGCPVRVAGKDFSLTFCSPQQGLPAGAGKAQTCLVLVWTHWESSELFHSVKFVTLAVA